MLAVFGVDGKRLAEALFCASCALETLAREGQISRVSPGTGKNQWVSSCVKTLLVPGLKTLPPPPEHGDWKLDRWWRPEWGEADPPKQEEGLGGLRAHP